VTPEERKERARNAAKKAAQNRRDPVQMALALFTEWDSYTDEQRTKVRRILTMLEVSA
jgi:hypothetical protein